jgi:hypothetical protein
MRSSGVEECRRSMRKVTLRHLQPDVLADAKSSNGRNSAYEVVSLYSFRNVLAVDTDSHTHQHVLRTLSDLPIDAEEVRALEGLEAKIILDGERIINLLPIRVCQCPGTYVAEIAVVDDCAVQYLGIVSYNFVSLVGDHRG